jgi:gas vesicle protein
MRAARAIVTSLAAAIVGAGAALLFAPQSGERTRRQIRRKTEDLIRDVREGLGFRVREASKPRAETPSPATVMPTPD